MADIILLVEDNIKSGEWIKIYIEREGYVCVWAHNGRDALDIMAEQDIALIVLDIMLPQVDGWTVCQQIRKSSDVPIIMATARTTYDDVIHGLEIGADDYIKKPIHLPELIARIQSLLRRSQGQLASTKLITVGALVIDPQTAHVSYEGQPISLSKRQYDLLVYLAQNAGQIISREAIINHLYSNDYDSFDRSIDTLIWRLRKQLEISCKDHNLIESIYGHGYRLVVK